MTDWRTPMRELIARDEQEGLSADEAQAMRSTVIAVAASQVSRSAVPFWTRPIFVAATVVAMIAVGIAAGLRVGFSTPSERATQIDLDATSVELDAAARPAGASNRQLQFLTPGGTRIIWVFNSDLDLKATLR